MPSLVSSLNASQPIDDELGVILESIVQRIQLGHAIDLDAIAAAYPAYASQLRELVPAAEVLARMGGADLAVPASAAGVGLSPAGGHLEPVRQLGDFRIARELGRGGMGTVFEAEQLTMGRRVALKVLPFAALAHEKSIQRFRNEVRAAAALDHPNIVSVYSVGEERGIHYFAMQLIRGQTLAEYIAVLKASRGVPAPGASGSPRASGNENATIDMPATVPPSTIALAHAQISTAPDSRRKAEHYRTAARLGIQAAEALQHAHDQGVLHRDVKPGNLMLDGDGKLYVTDFGLARIEAEAGMTMTGDIVGTLRYMAPEQALAKRVVIDHRADAYSLGATLYELLTLEPAFGETDREELLKQIAFEEPRPLRKIDRHIPAEVETIVLKTMAKSPDERYQRMGDLAADLKAFLDDRPIAAKPASLVRRLSRWARRRRGVAMTAAIAGILLLMAGSAALADRHRRLRDAREFVETTSAAALAAMEADDLTIANLRVAEALSRVAADDLQDSPLANRCIEIQEETSRYTKFLAECEIARHARTPDVTTNVGRVDAALQHYDVRSNPKWLEALEGHGWPKAHIERIKENAYEMLLLRADCLTRWERSERTAALCGEARECLKQALTFHAPSRGSYWLLGNCAHVDGDKKRARILHERSLEIEPQSAAELFYIDRDRRWGTHSAMNGYAAYPVAQSLAALRAMIRFDPNYYNAYFSIALKLAEEQRHDEALLGWYACLARFPDDASAQCNLASAHSQLGHYHEAITHAVAILGKTKKDSFCSGKALEIRGLCYYKLERYEEALADYDLALAKGIAELRPALLNHRALTHRELGHHALALADLEEALNLQPKAIHQTSHTARQVSQQTYAQLAQQLACSPVDELRDGKRALKLAQRAHEMTGIDQAVSALALATAHAELGDFNAAVSWTEKALAIQKSSVSSTELNERIDAFRRGEPWRFVTE